MGGYEELIRYFENQLNKQAFGHEPGELYAPISYTVGLGGKRIRPILTLMSCELFGGKKEEALSQAIAIELFHNFTLIHDDIMDNAPIRRGEETVFKKWNANIAILSGDTLFALAYQYAQQARIDILPETLSVFSKTAIEVCEGQQFDLNYENRNDVSVDEYIEMIRLKTAVLFGASLKIGALVGGAKIKDANALYEFGINIGLGFQLKDDLLDTFGDEEVFGKKTGGDIISNKKTFLYLKALEMADASTKNELISLYNTNGISNDNKTERVKKIFEMLKVDRLTNQLIDRYYLEGMKKLDEISIEETNKEILKDVAHRMIDRDK
ncbi:MAG: polyprenyl synthetase family protein [Bacteroidales bacterium]|jgi:geranylgeranyl diphosphate synthase type II|nr:polyprenyl synthetase family protein [Bacteroidales bacterium]